MSQPKAYADVLRPPVSEILIFTVDDRRYGLSTACVQELVRAVRLVPVPHPVDGIEGVIDLHGQIVPVIDLRSLGLEAKAPHPTEHLIIVRTEARLVAIRADRATEVRQIEPEMVGVVIGD
jgi:purine-binding chemotaxis protein CheW